MPGGTAAHGLPWRWCHHQHRVAVGAAADAWTHRVQRDQGRRRRLRPQHRPGPRPPGRPVNAVCPGEILTPMVEAHPPEPDAASLTSTPWCRSAASGHRRRSRRWSRSSPRTRRRTCADPSSRSTKRRRSHEQRDNSVQEVGRYSRRSISVRPRSALRREVHPGAGRRALAPLIEPLTTQSATLMCLMLRTVVSSHRRYRGPPARRPDPLRSGFDDAAEYASRTQRRYVGAARSRTRPPRAPARQVRQTLYLGSEATRQAHTAVVLMASATRCSGLARLPRAPHRSPGRAGPTSERPRHHGLKAHRRPVTP